MENLKREKDKSGERGREEKKSAAIFFTMDLRNGA